MPAELVSAIRDRMMPMLTQVANEYRYRVPEGYPAIVDTPHQGVVGIELDPSYALYIVSDGTQLYADVYTRNPRNNNHSSASREKFGGVPDADRRPLDPGISDQGLRNLIAELMSRWNFQPLILYITDD